MANSGTMSVAPDLVAIKGAGFDTTTDAIVKIRDVLTAMYGSSFLTGDDALSELEPKIMAIRNNIIPQLKFIQVNTASSSFVTALSLSFSGILYELHGKTQGGSDNMEFRVTIDSLAAQVFETGVGLERTVRRFVTDYPGIFLLVSPSSNLAQNLDLQFKNSLLVEYRRSAGTGDVVELAILYGELG